MKKAFVLVSILAAFSVTLLLVWPSPVAIDNSPTAGSIARPLRAKGRIEFERETMSAFRAVMSLQVEQSATKDCPSCRSTIDASASVCPRCTKDLPEWARSFPEAMNKFIAKQEGAISELRSRHQ